MSNPTIISNNENDQTCHNEISACETAVQPDEVFNFNLISFQVEKTVFRVITHGLVTRGSAFEAMLSLPNANHGEGSTNENPIVLQGIQARHFRAFLRVVYGSLEDQCALVVDFDDWVGVLSLSTMWEFPEVRSKAVEELSTLLSNRNVLEKFHLGRKYVVFEWTRDALVALVRQNPLDLEQLTKPESPLDWKIIAKIYRAREEIYRLPAPSCRHCRSLYQVHEGHCCYAVPVPPTELIAHAAAVPIVNQIFKEELGIPL